MKNSDQNLETLKNKIIYEKAQKNEKRVRELEKELQALHEKIKDTESNFYEDSGFKYISKKILDAKISALKSQGVFYQKFGSFQRKKLIYLRLLSLKEKISKDFKPYVDESSDSKMLADPYKFKDKLIDQLLEYAKLIRVIQDEIMSCIELGSLYLWGEALHRSSFPRNTIEIEAIKILITQKIKEGYFPSKNETDQYLSKILEKTQANAVENYLQALLEKSNQYKELKIPVDNIPFMVVINQIKVIFDSCRDAMIFIANNYDLLLNYQKAHHGIQQSGIETKIQEFHSKAANIIKTNPEIGAHINTLKQSIQNYLLNESNTETGSKLKTENGIVTSFQWNKDPKELVNWETPYNMMLQLSRFLREILQPADVLPNPSSAELSPPWITVFKQLEFTLKKKLELKNVQKTSDFELKDIDVSTAGNYKIEVVIDYLTLFKKYIIYKNKSKLVDTILKNLDVVITILTKKFESIKQAEVKLNSLRTIATEQYEEFLSNHKKNIPLELKKVLEKLLTILPADATTKIVSPKSELKSENKQLCELLLDREKFCEEQLSKTITVLTTQQRYMDFIVELHAISRSDLWQEQMYKFFLSTEKFSKNKISIISSSSNDSKNILSSLHSLILTLSKDMGEMSLNLLSDYYEGMANVHTHLTSARDLFDDLSNYNEIFNLKLESFKRQWLLDAEKEDKRVSTLRTVLIHTTANMKMSSVFPKLNEDARKSMGQLGSVDHQCITSYSRLLAGLENFQKIFKKAKKPIGKEEKYENNDNFKPYQDLSKLISELNKKMLSYEQNSKDYSAWELFSELSDVEWKILILLTDRLKEYTNDYINHHKLFLKEEKNLELRNDSLHAHSFQSLYDVIEYQKNNEVKKSENFDPSKNSLDTFQELFVKIKGNVNKSFWQQFKKRFESQNKFKNQCEILQIYIKRIIDCRNDPFQEKNIKEMSAIQLLEAQISVLESKKADNSKADVDQLVKWIENENSIVDENNKKIVALFRRYKQHKSSSKSFDLRKSLKDFLEATIGVQSQACNVLYAVGSVDNESQYDVLVYHEIINSCNDAPFEKKCQFLKDKISEIVCELMRKPLQREENFYSFYQSITGINIQQSPEKELILTLIQKNGVHERIRLLRSRIGKEIMPYSEAQQKLNTLSSRRRELQKSIGQVVAQPQKDQPLKLREFFELKNPQSNSNSDQKQMAEPEMFQVCVNTFVRSVRSKIEDDMSDSLDAKKTFISLPESKQRVSEITNNKLTTMSAILKGIVALDKSKFDSYCDRLVELISATPPVLIEEKNLPQQIPPVSTPELKITPSLELGPPIVELVTTTSLHITESKDMHSEIEQVTDVKNVIPKPLTDSEQLVEETLQELAGVERLGETPPKSLKVLYEKGLIKEFVEVWSSDLLTASIVDGENVFSKREAFANQLKRSTSSKCINPAQTFIRNIIDNFMEFPHPLRLKETIRFYKASERPLKKALRMGMLTLAKKQDKPNFKGKKGLKEIATHIKITICVFSDNKYQLYPENAHEFNQIIFLFEGERGKKIQYCPLILDEWIKEEAAQSSNEVSPSNLKHMFPHKKKKVEQINLDSDSFFETNITSPRFNEQKYEPLSLIELDDMTLTSAPNDLNYSDRDKSFPEKITQVMEKEQKYESLSLVEPDPLRLTFNSDDLKYSENDKLLTVKVIQNLIRLANVECSKEEYNPLHSQTILTFFFCSFHIFLNVWTDNKMNNLDKACHLTFEDYAIEDSETITLREYTKHHLLESLKAISAEEKSLPKIQAINFLLMFPVQLFTESSKMVAFIPLKNGIFAGVEEGLWRCVFTALALHWNFRERYQSYLDMKADVLKDCLEEPKSKCFLIAEKLIIDIIMYSPKMSSVSSGPNRLKIYILKEGTSFYPLIPVTSLKENPQRVLDLMSAMNSFLPKDDPQSSVSLTSVKSPSSILSTTSDLTSPVSQSSTSLTPASESELVSPPSTSQESSLITTLAQRLWGSPNSPPPSSSSSSSVSGSSP